MEIPDVTKIVTDLLVRYSFQVIAAVAILFVGLLCARVVGRFIERSLRRTAIEAHLQRLLVRAGKALVLLFTAILALDKFGVQVTALVAGISVAGVAASFAVQGILANLAAGLSIMLSRHFRIGDYIEIGTVKGQVQSIDLTMTVLRTLEDARVIVPNRKIVGEIIHNYTGERRVTLKVQVGYNAGPGPGPAHRPGGAGGESAGPQESAAGCGNHPAGRLGDPDHAPPLVQGGPVLDRALRGVPGAPGPLPAAGHRDPVPAARGAPAAGRRREQPDYHEWPGRGCSHAMPDPGRGRKEEAKGYRGGRPGRRGDESCMCGGGETCGESLVAEDRARGILLRRFDPRQEDCLGRCGQPPSAQAPAGHPEGR